MKFLTRRKRSAHKGEFGHVLVLAGALGYTGAAILTSRAALLSGSGMVTLGIPRSLDETVSKRLLEAVTLPLPETRQKTFSVKALPAVLKKTRTVDTLAIGPGLSQQAETVRLVQSLLPQLDCPTVLDADGLNALSKNIRLLKRVKAPFVLTPHPGEMGRLIGKTNQFVQKNRQKVAKAFSVQYNVVTVLKGHRTVVVSPRGRCFINQTGNPGMASAGCGDVLTGILGSFLGQGMAPFEAACRAVYVHGLAGDLAAKEKGEVSLIATDLLTHLPHALKRVTKPSSLPV